MEGAVVELEVRGGGVGEGEANLHVAAAHGESGEVSAI